MQRFNLVIKLLPVILIALVVVLSACKSPTGSTTTPGTTKTSTTTTSPMTYSVTQLKYILISRYTDLFWCDPDLYPIVREGQEQQNAITQFSTIQANSEEFAAILHQFDLPVKTDYSDEETLLIYRQHKLLTYGLEVTGTASPYNFTLRTGKNQGFRITGIISSSGTITEMEIVTSFNTCPICLAKGTIISTPLGPIPVEDLRQGMLVWTQGSSGRQIEAMLVKVSRTPVPSGFHMVKIVLSDGRSITASPGHPTADLKPLGNYKVGDTMDGAVITGIEQKAYTGDFTYDILPVGHTGTYLANGIWLKSTLPEY